MYFGKFYKHILTIGLLFIASQTLEANTEEENPIIMSDKENLRANLEKAKKLALESGKEVTVRMNPREDIEAVRDDQKFAQDVIAEEYGDYSIKSVKIAE